MRSEPGSPSDPISLILVQAQDVVLLQPSNPVTQNSEPSTVGGSSSLEREFCVIHARVGDGDHPNSDGTGIWLCQMKRIWTLTWKVQTRVQRALETNMTRMQNSLRFLKYICRSFTMTFRYRFKYSKLLVCWLHAVHMVQCNLASLTESFNNFNN